ncbi:MAG: fibronectin type III domain-containing protein [Candidatus Kapabacteria bacterium]|nr:fibronectin type III domain-containing protein [Candidatus Kapabacteria bacterium]
MATGDFVPQKEGDLLPWLDNFIAIGTANLATLGMSTTIITNLTTLKSAFATNFTAAEAKQLEAKAATENKNLAKKAVINEIRVNVKQIQAKPGVPANLKAQLGITVPGSQPAPPGPVPPLALVALAQSNGINSLNWNRNGNTQNTLFIIEYRHAVTQPWQMAGTTLKATFDHLNQTPGYTLYYQVKAQRNEMTSPPSNEVIVYAEGAGPVSPV